MTREEAIKTLKENYCAMCAYGSQNMDSCDIRSCDNRDAIKALEQESCDDCVRRQEVLDSIHANCVYENEYNLTAKHIEDAVKQLPSVTSQQKIGHWIYDNATYNWRCDKCGETPKTMGYVGSDKFMAEHFKFCNHCGAKMIEPQESENKK